MSAAATAKRTGELDAEGTPRKKLAWGAGLLLGGLALVGIGESDAGMALSLAGLVGLIWGIHSFGRLGPSETEAAGETIADEPEPPRRTSRAQKKPRGDVPADR